MCGGRGTRLESDREKPLYPIDGVAMVDRVLRALAESAVETTHAVVSPNAPETRDYLASDDGPALIDTPGEGYVSDLGVALESEAVTPPVLTVAADLPLLEAATIDRVLERHDDGSATVCVPVALKRRLGASVDATLAPHLAPTGVNVVGASTERQMTYVHYDPRLALNVNRLEDARLAEERCE